MDSKKIVGPLEQMFPEPSLHLDEDIVQKAESLVSPLFFKIHGVWMPKVPYNLLPPRSKEYFIKDRSETLGKPLEEYHKLNGGDEKWQDVKPAYEELGGLLRKNGGPYFLGKTRKTADNVHTDSSWHFQASYADFYIVSFLQMLKVLDQAMFDRATSFDPAVKELYDACAKWLERNDWWSIRKGCADFVKRMWKKRHYVIYIDGARNGSNK